MIQELNPGDVVECISRGRASCLVVGKTYTVTKVTLSSLSNEQVVWLDNQVVTYASRLRRVAS